MIGYASDVDAVNDVVQDIDKLRQRHRDREIHDIFNDTSFGKNRSVYWKHSYKLLFFLRLDTI